MRTIKEQRQTISHSNDVVFQHLRETLPVSRYTGPIILHCNHGVIRKIELKDVVTTASLLTNGDDP